VREILVVSSDEPLTRNIRWSLEDAGFSVEVASSLEDTFFSRAHLDPFAVVVDEGAIPESEASARDILAWFHRRSPVVLLTNSEGYGGLEDECDFSFPKGAGDSRLLGCLRKLQQF